MPKKICCIILVMSTIYVGCAANLIPKQHSRIKNISEQYLGQSVEKFLEDNPNAGVDVIDIKSNNFRYYIRYFVACSFEEALLAPAGITNKCWIDAYYFSKDGIIVRYSFSRGSLY